MEKHISLHASIFHRSKEISFKLQLKGVDNINVPIDLSVSAQ